MPSGTKIHGVGWSTSTAWQAGQAGPSEAAHVRVWSVRLGAEASQAFLVRFLLSTLSLQMESRKEAA